MAQALVANINDHRVETALEPEKERLQVPGVGPNGGNTVPAIQVLLEDFVADLGQMLQCLLFGVPLRQEVYRRL